MRSLRQNLGLKTVAVLVAVLFWVLAHQEVQKRETREYRLPVQVTGLDEGIMLVRRPPQVTLKLAGPKGILDSVDPNQLTAYVDAQGQATGPCRRLVQYGPATLPSGLLITVDPREVAFELDKTTTNELTIQVLRSSEPPVGVEIEGLVPTPTSATVNGASTQVAKVHILQVAVDVARLGDLTPGDHPLGDYPVRPLDADGRPVANVSVMPASVEVTLQVSRAAVTRTVLISPRIGGRPPGTYEIKEIIVEPREITITGAPAAVAAVSTVRTEQIDVSNLRDRIVRIVALTPIANVSFGGRDKVRVTVRVGERADTSEGGASE
jgi:YbbR domain-containing protein